MSFRKGLSLCSFRVKKEESIIFTIPKIDDPDEVILGHFLDFQDDKVQKELILGCVRGDLDMLRDEKSQPELDSKVNVPITSTGDTLLHLASRLHRAKVIEYLLQHGANVFAKNNAGQTPLGVLCRCANLDCTAKTGNCAKILLRHVKEGDQDFCTSSTKAVLAEAINHSQEMAELVMMNCWVYVISAANKYEHYMERSLMERCLGFNREVPKGSESKFPLCDILKKYPILVESLMRIYDCKLTFREEASCININTTQTQVQLDFTCLIPQAKKENEAFKALGCDKYDTDEAHETELLMKLVETSPSVRKTILLHPLLKAFLHLKWKRFQPFALISIAFYVLLSVLMTMYVLSIQLGKCRIRPDLNTTWYQRSTRNSAKNRTWKHLFMLLQNPPPLMSHAAKDFCTVGSSTYFIQSVIWLMILIIVILEVFECYHDGWKYFRDVRNWLQWTYAVCAAVSCTPIFMIDSNTFMYVQYQTAGFGLLIVWALLLVQVSKSRTLAIYVDMLFKVIQSFIKFILTFACLFIGFMLCNTVLFSNFEPTQTVPRSILKTLTGMNGEFSYQDEFYQDYWNETDHKLKNKHILLYPVSAHIFYIVFIVVCSMALMNLLVGLAVVDVGEMRADAELNMLRRMTKEIFLMEKFIFKGRFPAWVHAKLKGAISLHLISDLTKEPCRCCKSETFSNSTKNAESKYLHESNMPSRSIVILPHCPTDKQLPEVIKLQAFYFARANQNSRDQSQEVTQDVDPQSPGSWLQRNKVYLEQFNEF